MANSILTSNRQDAEVYCYGDFKLRKGNLIDENGNFIVDEIGNNIYCYGIIENEE